MPTAPLLSLTTLVYDGLTTFLKWSCRKTMTWWASLWLGRENRTLVTRLLMQAVHNMIYRDWLSSVAGQDSDQLTLRAVLLYNNQVRKTATAWPAGIVRVICHLETDLQILPACRSWEPFNQCSVGTALVARSLQDFNSRSPLRPGSASVASTSSPVTIASTSATTTTTIPPVTSVTIASVKTASRPTSSPMGDLHSQAIACTHLQTLQKSPTLREAFICRFQCTQRNYMHTKKAGNICRVDNMQWLTVKVVVVPSCHSVRSIPACSLNRSAKLTESDPVLFRNIVHWACDWHGDFLEGGILPGVLVFHKGVGWRSWRGLEIQSHDSAILHHTWRWVTCMKMIAGSLQQLPEQYSPCGRGPQPRAPSHHQANCQWRWWCLLNETCCQMCKATLQKLCFECWLPTPLGLPKKP